MKSTRLSSQIGSMAMPCSDKKDTEMGKGLKLISYTSFAKLRMADFLIGQMVTEDVDHWEYRDQIWCGEVIGFTQFLRLKKEPEILRCISLDLSVHPQKVWNAILKAVRLPLAAGLSPAETKKILGKPREDKIRFGRRTLFYEVGKKQIYYLECVSDEQRLIYLNLLRGDYK